MDAEPSRYDLTCARCHEDFTLMSASGPSEICHACAGLLLEQLWGPGWREICVLY